MMIDCSSFWKIFDIYYPIKSIRIWLKTRAVKKRMRELGLGRIVVLYNPATDEINIYKA